MKQQIYYDFKNATASIKEQLQIVKHKAILSRMKVMGRFMKNKLKELDDMRHQSNSTKVTKTLYEKYSI